MKTLAFFRPRSSWLVTGRALRAPRLAAALSAALLIAPSAGLAQSAGAPQEVQITERARALFRAGVTLLQDPDGARYEEAYQQFKAAYAESPSWKILGNLGYTAMKLERDGEAIEAFRGYLEQGDEELSAAERAQFQSDLDTLRATAATVTILGVPAGTRVTDVRSPNTGPDIKNPYEAPEGEPLVLRVRPGLHRFTAQWGGGEPQTYEISTSAGGAHGVTFLAPQAEPEPLAPQPEPVQPDPGQPPAPAAVAASPHDDGFFQSPLPAYLSLGVGAVGVGLGVLFLVQRSSAQSDADSRFDACLASQSCVEADVREMDRLDEKAATMGTLSAVSFGVGAAGLGAGVALLLLSGDAEEEGPAALGASVRPYATARELGVWGRF